jgi:hypothetical protein
MSEVDLLVLRGELRRGGRQQPHHDNMASEAAAKRLIEIGSADAYNTLADSLGYGNFGHGSWYANEVALDALYMLGPSAVPIFIRVLGNPHPSTRKASAWLLYRLNEKHFFENLIKDDFEDIRRLGESDDSRTVSSLLEAARSDQDYSRYGHHERNSYSGHDWASYAVKMLRQSTSPAAIESLMQFRATLDPSQDTGRNDEIFRREVDQTLESLRKGIRDRTDASGEQSVGPRPAPAGRLVDAEDLVAAVGRREVDAVKMLLKKGVHVDAKDTFGRTALLMAAEKRTLPIIEILLAVGADINARDNNGATPLHHAANNPRLVRVFLAAGAHVNARDGSGQTPLWIATRSPGESLEAVKLLISAGAEVDIKNRYSESIFYTAMMNSNIRNTLLQHCEKMQPQKKSWIKRILERGSRWRA